MDLDHLNNEIETPELDDVLDDSFFSFFEKMEDEESDPLPNLDDEHFRRISDL